MLYEDVDKTIINIEHGVSHRAEWQRQGCSKWYENITNCFRHATRFMKMITCEEHTQLCSKKRREERMGKDDAINSPCKPMAKTLHKDEIRSLIRLDTSFISCHWYEQCSVSSSWGTICHCHDYYCSQCHADKIVSYSLVVFQSNVLQFQYYLKCFWNLTFQALIYRSL